ncbi:SitI3 family protein [Archangium sp.]|uniref:SitI3 family protein n=1 Tax=Archangium sp. TaxID=1872627 RepID=UPI00389AF9A1
MGFDYSLKLSTDMNRAHALGLLAEHIPGLQWSDENGSLFDSTLSNIIIAASELHGYSQAMIEEGFGFTPELSVLFRFPSNRDYDRFAQTMLRGVLLLLDHGRDGVLLFNGEIIVLQRLGGQLTLNSDYHIFDDKDWLKSILTTSFERRPLPSPLL